MNRRKHGLTTRRCENFPQWFQEVIRSADLAENSPVRGCMIIKPYGYKIWELIQKSLNDRIVERGVDNVYFPLLIPLSFLEREADHVDGFAKECAVVTNHRLVVDGDGKLVPDPEAQLTEPLVIRPTSETMVGHAMSGWIQSYRNLPMRLNQWANVMRWEMRPRLFLRTSEFLWQEGHTVHAEEMEAKAEASEMLSTYRTFVEDCLRIPVIVGEKTPSERFPGALITHTIETVTQDGKALQTATSHFLGQNFSRAYDIGFTDSDGNRQLAWTTSWGASTRLIGALIMTHSDDDGLVLPPSVAPYHVCIIPMTKDEVSGERVSTYCEQTASQLRQLSYKNDKLRVVIDTSDKRAAEKGWDWRRKGVPIQIIIGLREIETQLISLSRRDKTQSEADIYSIDVLGSSIQHVLQEIDQELYERAVALREERCEHVSSVRELENVFSCDDDEMSRFAVGSFDLALDSSEQVMNTLKQLRVTPRCVMEEFSNVPGECIFSGKRVLGKVMFARAY